MLKLRQNDVEKVLVSMGFEVAPINDNSFRANHDSFFNNVFTIDEVNDELQINSFFTGKKGADRAAFLDALNTCNRRSTITKMVIDDDGDLIVKRCIAAAGGFTKEQLQHVIKEGDREVQTNVSLITDFVD